MAEFAVTMMLALGMLDLIAQKRAEWPKDRWDRFQPLGFCGTVGIVGYGSIGEQIARLLNQPVLPSWQSA
jgi:phosphoglycerate dehydrogenase-like enzyme